MSTEINTDARAQSPTDKPAKPKKIARGLVALGLIVPSKDAIKLLPPFNTVNRRIVVINSANAVQAAAEELSRADIIGFDTENQPNFEKGQAPNPVALLQLATDTTCFMIQPLQLENKQLDLEPIRALLESDTLLKVGAGLKADKKMLKREFNFKLRGMVDLVSAFNVLGYKNDMGVKTMIAMLKGEYLRKSKRISRSNWAATTLTKEQCHYASDDAFAPVDTYRALVECIKGNERALKTAGATQIYSVLKGQ